MARVRTFSEDEQAARQRRATARAAADCAGCVETLGPEGYYNWSPAEGCPVHGADPVEWWAALNRELDQSWPGTWEGVTS